MESAEDVLLLEALLANLGRLRVQIGREWPSLRAQLQLPLAQLNQANSANEVRRALDNVVAILLAGPGAELVREILRESAHAAHRERSSAENHNTDAASTPNCIPAGHALAAALLEAGASVRYTDIACPNRVWVETRRITVVVRLTLAPTSYSAAIAPLSLPAVVPVRVRIDAPGFNVLGDTEQELVFSANRNSAPVVFDLGPRETGHTHVTLDFFQNGDPLGTVSLPVEITEHEVNAGLHDSSQQPISLPDAVEPPDLMLAIGCEPGRERPSLTFTFSRAGDVGRTFHPVLLRGEPQAHAAHLYEQLTTLTSQYDPTIQTLYQERRVLPAADIDRRIKQFGQNLWRSLVPVELRDLYAAERESWQGRTLLVVSDEPYLPWELVWPYGPGWEDEAPWCATLGMTRWLRRDAQGNGHESPARSLPVHSLACLAPDNSELVMAQQERNVLADLLTTYGVTDASPAAPTWNEVLNLIEACTYDWLHVAAHGNFYSSAPDTDSAIWLDDDRPLTPDVFVGPAVEEHLRSGRPGFVLNACHGGRTGWTLTALGGWAGRLISGGAGLFAGPLWTVEDEAALAFAEAFYRSLFAGATVAESVRAARQAARRPGNPTWLAYSVYAHPNARLAGLPTRV